MPANVEFVDYAGQPTTALPQRRNNCITTSAWEAGTGATLSVTAQNVGDETCMCTVEFFLERPGGPNPPPPLAPSLCKPAANPMAPTGIDPGEQVTFSLGYIVQSGDVGADTLYAQIQMGTGPFPNPSDMTQACNASKSVGVLPLVLEAVKPVNLENRG
jgi:hypothetical protein